MAHARKTTPDADLAVVTAPHVLREYALIADGQRGALVGPQGDIAWMCAPRWDSDGVFSSLLGGPGTYVVAPRARRVWGGYYEEGTLVWRSRWVSDDGIVECREALAYPGDDSRAVLLRRVMAGERAARMRVVLSVRAGFGHSPMTMTAGEGGVWEGRSGPLHLRWSGAEGARPCTLPDRSSALAMELDVAPGRHHDLVLEISDQALEPQSQDPDVLWEATERAWRAGVPQLERTLAPRDARQAFAVLRGMTTSGGGMVAAATMGLPERAHQGRNYDYRYVWVRDQCYAGLAVAAAGAHDLLDDAVRFVSERILADGADLKPAYTSSGGAVPDERDLALPGYPGAQAVCGNWVNGQFQLDAFGESLLLLAAAARHDRLDADGRRAITIAADAIARRWTEPDAGIWEIDDRAWTHSRLICAAGLRAVARDAPGDRGADWAALADAIVAHTAGTSLHPSGRWQRSPEDPRPDVALLLAGVRGAIAADDPRTVATLEAVLADLCDEGYAYRFRQDERPLGEAEGAFLLCGFVIALAAHQQGDVVRAVHWFERSRSACGSPGLFSEEYDVAQRQLRGNLPQAFVHALMLECAARLSGDPE